MHFHIITLFPEMFDSYLSESILARAQKEKKIKISFYNPRKFVIGKYKKVWPDGAVSQIVDDRPYGGGPGMIIRAEPVLKAIATAKKKAKGKTKIILLAPSGKKFTTAYAKAMRTSRYTDVIIIAGRYEGIDARVQKITKAEPLSIGDYVLTGGELPAMVVIDCIARQIPGVLGNFESLEEERISSSEFYTRPEELVWEGKKYRVPKVLLSGDHKAIEVWKEQKIGIDDKK